MIDRFEILASRIRYAVSRTRWSTRLLGHEVSEGHETEPGLVLVQIDGVSEDALRRALREGRMPFLRGLVEREGYRVHPLYTGLPSNTPAFQGELFYGVPGAVPAFRYRDPESGRTVALSDRDAAAAVEARLAAAGPGLLRGGTAWSNVFAGGAAESHLCASTRGLRAALGALAPRRVVPYVLWHGWSLVRAAVNAGLVSALAMWDLGHRRLDGSELLSTLRFVPLRVGVSVLMREIVTTGASVDAERGVPIIQLNFLGYDEHAHRRGPSSRFAKWSLRGIDSAVRRVWLAAHRSRRRDYQVWIYSDHGQERVAPFTSRFGGGAPDAVRALAARLVPADVPSPPPETVGQGPILHVHLGARWPEERLDALAAALVAEAGIPSVLRRTGTEGATAWTGGARFRLPEEGSAFLGPGHPHAEAAAVDLVRLAHHPAAGDLILLGWSAEGPRSFHGERGTHGGPGPGETSAFLVLPPEAEAYVRAGEPIRPATMRRMAARALERRGDSAVEVLEGPAPYAPPRLERHNGMIRVRLRLMTYNVHGCRGMDGVYSPGRIARVIARERPDVVCLQELDQERTRSGRVDQIELIARRIRADFHFHAVTEIDDGRFGNAVLSSLPLRLVHAAPLPSAPRAKSVFNLWDRGALCVRIEAGCASIDVINTHLSILQHERRLQAEALLGGDWIGRPGARTPIILAGDFNAAPGSWTLSRLESRLRNVVDPGSETRALRTWTGRLPVRRIDHVLINEDVTVECVYVPRTRLSRVASDHLPLVVDLVCLCRAASPEREAAGSAVADLRS